MTEEPRATATQGSRMTITASGKYVVAYTTDEDIDINVEVDAKSIDIGEPELHAEDRGMGPELVYTATASAEHLGDLEWRIYEYPVGVLNYVDVPDIPHTVLQQPAFSIRQD